VKTAIQDTADHTAGSYCREWSESGILSDGHPGTRQRKVVRNSGGLDGHGTGSSCLAALPGGLLVAVGGQYFEYNIFVWDISTAHLNPREVPVADCEERQRRNALMRAGMPVPETAPTGWTLIQTLHTACNSMQGVPQVLLALPGDLLASGISGGSIQLWAMSDVRNMSTSSLDEPIRTMVGHKTPAPRLSPDGYQRGHDKGVLSLASLPDLSSPASGGADAVVHIWDVATGHLVRSLTGHSSPISALRGRRAPVSYRSTRQ
jgi:WD40 repeat protein